MFFILDQSFFYNYQQYPSSFQSYYFIYTNKMIQLAGSRKKQKITKPNPKNHNPFRAPKNNICLQQQFTISSQIQECSKRKASLKRKKSIVQQFPSQNRSCKDYEEEYQQKTLEGDQDIEKKQIQVMLPHIDCLERQRQSQVKGRKTKKKVLLKSKSRKKNKMRSQKSQTFESQIIGQESLDFKVKYQKTQKKDYEEEEIKIGPWQQMKRTTRFPFLKICTEEKQLLYKQEINKERSIVRNSNDRGTKNTPDFDGYQKYLFQSTFSNKVLFPQTERDSIDEEKVNKNMKNYESQRKKNRFMLINKMNLYMKKKRSQTSAEENIHTLSPARSDKKIGVNRGKYAHFNFLKKEKRTNTQGEYVLEIIGGTPKHKR